MDNKQLISTRAKNFANKWKGKGTNEIGETQTFWTSLLTSVFGVPSQDIADFIQFEDRVSISPKSKGRIDAYIPSTKVLIEQKKVTIDLDTPLIQSDGTKMTPFEQAKKYIVDMKVSAHPKYVITCNFREFRVYDMNTDKPKPEIIKLEDLETDYYRLSFLVNSNSVHLAREMDISYKAGEIIGKLYDALRKEYKDPDSSSSLHSLSQLCVRLIFCLYAEDADLFKDRLYFHDYMEKYKIDARNALIKLFKILDEPEEKRDPYENRDLLSFPYVNGGLFAGKIEIPRITVKATDLLLDKASAKFNWSGISPTIFGALFESTINPITRRSGGMHYTSIENIHKVIDPLFLDDLKKELSVFKNAIKGKSQKDRASKLCEFQNKLASIVILDPAAGSGNFLTESYLSLRRLENEAIRCFLGGQTLLGSDDFSPIKVNINQFYGIEINGFAVAVAKTALWIAEHQMMKETASIIDRPLDLLPLASNSNLVEANALQIDWNDVVPRKKLKYIIGNPPFVGARIMSNEQKSDIEYVFKGLENNGDLDYVAGWYKKATDFMKGTSISTALVSTNSICQGNSVYILWKPLFEQGVSIDFAYHTFCWDSEAEEKAKVHCIIVGFSTPEKPSKKDKYIFSEETCFTVKHINAYLNGAEDLFVKKSNKPICKDAPNIKMGNQPIDNGNYLFKEDEMQAFIKKEPASEKYFHKWYGSKELINNELRWCLWLGECSPHELRSMPECLKRVEAVRLYRLSSNRESTKKLADKPTRFQTENFPSKRYIAIPETSSWRRNYIPLCFFEPEIMCSNAIRILPGATTYHFGVLTSSVHMAWMRAVAGRLKSDYRYSKDIVYTTFPWPEVTEDQKEKIAQTAQAILDARSKYPDSSLADLYNNTIMPFDLRRAHELNDKAVLKAYGLDQGITEDEIVRHLYKLYLKIMQSNSKAKKKPTNPKKDSKRKNTSSTPLPFVT